MICLALMLLILGRRESFYRSYNFPVSRSVFRVAILRYLISCSLCEAFGALVKGFGFHPSDQMSPSFLHKLLTLFSCLAIKLESQSQLNSKGLVSHHMRYVDVGKRYGEEVPDQTNWTIFTEETSNLRDYLFS